MSSIGRAMGACVLAGACGCFYLPRAPHGPPGHTRLDPNAAPLEAGAPVRVHTARPVVLQRPESLVLQPIGGVYDGDLQALIRAPHIEIDAFECMTSALRRAGADARKDYSTSDPSAPLDPALAATRPARIRLVFERVRADVEAETGTAMADARILVAVAPGAGPHYERALELRGRLAANGDIDLGCRLGEVAAARLLADARFLSAIGASR